jgi:tetratricopeptide (TPR) repeat protein
MPPDKRPPPARGPVDTDPSGAPAHEPSTTEPSMPAAVATTTEPSMPAARAVPPPRKPGSSAKLAPVARGRAAEPVKDRSVRPPRERPNRRRREEEAEPKKKGGSGKLLFVCVLVFGGLGFGYWYKQNHLPPPALPAGPDPGLAELGGLMQEGKNLVRAGRFADARAKFQQVFDVNPTYAQGAVKTYLDACTREIPNQQHLDAASDAISKNELGRAETELKAITANSTQTEKIENMKKKLDDALTARIAEGRVLAQSPRDTAKMKKLKALADDILVAKPEQRDATELRDLAARMLGGPVHVEVEAPPAGDPAVDVMARYASGDASGAFALANDCAGKSPACAGLVEKMKTLNELLQKVEGLQPEELDKALSLDHACSGGKTTPHAKPIATRMASAYYQKASNLKTKGEWGGAMAAARKALLADPDNMPAKSIMVEGMEQARNLFQRCYISKDASPEDAIPLCTQVVQMLPEGDELRGKAERVLQSLRQH